MNFGLDYSEWDRFLHEWKDTRALSILGSNLILFDEIDSTNSFIKTNLSDIKANTIVISRIQTSGKGQKQRKWNSDKGGLYLSIKLDIQKDKTIIPFWIIATLSISLCEYFESIGLNSRLKWPNDVLINERKVCGILTENVFYKDHIIVIIGIGININNSMEKIYLDFPELRGKIATIIDIMPNFSNSHLKAMLSKLCGDLEFQLKLDNPFSIHNLKKKWSEYSKIINKEVTIKNLKDEVIYSGRVKDISNIGSLLVEVESDEIKEFFSGDIKVQE